MDNKYLVPEFLFALALIFFLLRKADNPPMIIFWISVLGTLISAMKLSGSRYRIVSVLIVATVITSVYAFGLPKWYQANTDTAFEAQFAQIIIDEQLWNPQLGTGFAGNYYGYNPALHFSMAFISMLTSISPYLIAKYFYIFVLRILFLVIVYLIYSEVVKDKYREIPYFAALLLIGTGGFSNLVVSRRAIADIFSLLFILFMLKKTKTDNVAMRIVSIVSALMIVLSDHSTSYLMIIFLAGFEIFKRLSIKQRLKALHIKLSSSHNFYFTLNSFFLVLIIFLVWESQVATILIQKEVEYFSGIISLVLGFIRPRVSTEIFSPRINYLSERLIAYASQFVILGLAVIGIYLLLREHSEKRFKNRNLYFIIYWILFSLPLFIVCGYLFTTSWSVIADIYVWLAYVPLCLLISYLLIRLEFIAFRFNLSRIALYLLIIMIFIGSLFVGQTPVFNRPIDQDILLEDPRAVSDTALMSGNWLSAAPGNVIADPSLFVIYSGYYMLNVTANGLWTKEIYLQEAHPYREILSRDDISFSSHFEFDPRYGSVDYIVRNENVFAYPSSVFGNPLSADNFIKFDNEALANKVYQNKKESVYASLVEG